MSGKQANKSGSKKVINNADLIRQSQSYSLVDFEEDVPIQQPKKRDRQHEDSKTSKRDTEKVKSKSKAKSKSLRDYGDKHDSSVMKQ